MISIPEKSGMAVMVLRCATKYMLPAESIFQLEIGNPPKMGRCNHVIKPGT